MTTTITQHMWAALIGTVLLSSCSRPVAYFQRGVAEPVSTVTAQSKTVPVLPAVPAPLESPRQPGEAEIVYNAYARMDNHVVTSHRVQERMNRIETVRGSAHTPQRSEEGSTYRNMNRVERLMLKVMNRKISRQLAPHHPEKPMINRPIQVVGAGILLIGGLLLLILGTGTVAFIGLILSLIGAVGVIVGLFGI